MSKCRFFGFKLFSFVVTNLLEQIKRWDTIKVMRRAEERLLNPPPGGRIEAARAHGIDLSLLVERLRKTPEERVRDLQSAVAGLEAVRGKALKASRVRERRS